MRLIPPMQYIVSKRDGEQISGIRTRIVLYGLIYIKHFSKIYLRIHLVIKMSNVLVVRVFIGKNNLRHLPAQTLLGKYS